MRFVLLALCAGLWGLLGAPDAQAAVPVVVVDGRGWGHGVGMAQDGAYWMASAGASMDDILGHFYPGTDRASSTGAVRVVVLVSGDDRAVLELPDGGEVRSPRSGPQRAGFPVSVPAGGAVTVARDGDGYRVTTASGTVAAAAVPASYQLLPLPTTSSTSSTSTTSTTGVLPLPTTTTAPPPGGAPPPTTTAPPPSPEARSTEVHTTEPVWVGPVTAGGTVAVPARGFRYRGELEVSGSPLRVVNELDVEQYLWGLAEVGASFPQEALRAQVVAARTYALRAMAANGEICDSQRCQVYKGASGEFGGQVEAVNATLGTTLSYRGGFASAVFSANAAGFSATPSEGFGTSDASHPYLVAAPYETQSPDPWQVRISLADLATRLRYPGEATSIQVAETGPSGRPVAVELDGSAGRQRVAALDVDAAMGLRSTMWSLRVELADEAPASPEAGSIIQAAPEAVGDALAAEATRVLASPSTDRARATTTIVVGSTLPLGNGTEDDDAWWLLVVPVVLAGAVGMVTLARARGTGPPA